MSSTRKMSEHPNPAYNLPDTGDTGGAATEAAEVAEVAEAVIEAAVAEGALGFGGEVVGAAAVEAALGSGSDGAIE